ncbi:MAG: 16S rRNA processing protein RimM [Firmicutes bacterium]|nr:16S rRNA processing protein RimM [Bacillota bacterium]MBR6700858.1 16S rRNA processing protein RimM [Bacillota bacterium]
MLKRFKLGQIVNAVGLKGESKVYPYTDYKERFEELDSLYIENTVYKIEKVRYMGEMAIVKFAGVSDRNAAEALKGKYLYIDRENARELGEDEYFVPDLIGLQVKDEAGENIGELCDVIQNSAQDVYEIKMPDGKTFMIPAVGEFILKVDMDNREMVVRLIEGMID